MSLKGQWRVRQLLNGLGPFQDTWMFTEALLHESDEVLAVDRLYTGATAAQHHYGGRATATAASAVLQGANTNWVPDTGACDANTKPQAALRQHRDGDHDGDQGGFNSQCGFEINPFSIKLLGPSVSTSARPKVRRCNMNNAAPTPLVGPLKMWGFTPRPLMGYCGCSFCRHLLRGRPCTARGRRCHAAW